MVSVRQSADAVDKCDPSPAVRIVSVGSNQGRDHSEPDWQVTGPLGLDLRSERSGAGAGRIYTILVEALAGPGNRATSVVTVAVPKTVRDGRIAKP